MNNTFVIIGISHSTVPIEVRERFALSEFSRETLLTKICAATGICECAILNTCNRIEIYLVAESEHAIDTVQKTIFDKGKLQQQDAKSVDEYIYRYRDEDAIFHVLKVVAGIDSLIPGESQILGQVKQCAAHARRCGTVGTILNDLFHRAVAFGKYVRTHTDIARGTVSVSSAAVNLIFERMKSLEGKTIILIGTGKMSKLAARRLVDNTGARLIVASRRLERARSFTARIPGAEPVEFSSALSFLRHADIVLTSTDAPHYLLQHDAVENIMRERKFSPLCIIDIAVPRDVDPDVQKIRGVTLCNIDDLRHIVDQTRAERRLAATKIETLARDETLKLQQRVAVRSMKPLIMSFRRYVAQQCNDEIDSLKKALGPDLSEEARTHLDNFARSLTNKLAHYPLKRIKEAARNDRTAEYKEILEDLLPEPESRNEHKS